MKKILSVLLALGLLISSQSIAGLSAYAEDTVSPHITIEVSDYISSTEISEKSGRGKTSAEAGDLIAVTFILSGMSSIECYQISGHYDTDKLSAGYYRNDVWITGDEEQDYNTVIAGSDVYSDSKLDDSFSFTRTIEEPYICLVGYSLTGEVPINSETKLITVGFEALDDIENIYNAFIWDDNTMVAVSVDEDEYDLSSGLEIGCKHNFVTQRVDVSCTHDGYILYSCQLCSDTYMTDYVYSTGHSYELTQKTDDVFTFRCSVCNRVTDKTAQQLSALWNSEYINLPPSGKNPSCFLDLHEDNIINAKDYAIIIGSL